MRSVNFIYLTKLDHLRFIAAILVIFHHFRGESIRIDQLTEMSISNFMKIWLVQGSSGVSLFLVLSAFLFTLIANAGINKINYKNFIYNRILRIFPLLTVLVFIVLTINRAGSGTLDIFRVITLQLNTGHSMTGWGHEFFPTGPIWTIAVEFQFYLLFPILMMLIVKFGIRYLVLSILFILMMRFAVVSLTHDAIYYNIYHSILGRLDQFFVGIILGVLYVRGYFNFLKNGHAILLILLSIFLLTLIMYKNRNITQFSSTLYFTIEAVFWAIFILGYLSFKTKENKVLSLLSKMLAFGGMLSFSIYLLHLPVGMVVSNILEMTEPNSLSESILNSMIRLPFILICSVLSFYAIEKPFMSFRIKYLKD